MCSGQLGIGGAIFWYLKTTLYGTKPDPDPKHKEALPELLAQLDAESKHTTGAYWRAEGPEPEQRRQSD